jgi:hypothetical protein
VLIRVASHREQGHCFRSAWLTAVLELRAARQAVYESQFLMIKPSTPPSTTYLAAAAEIVCYA